MLMRNGNGRAPCEIRSICVYCGSGPGKKPVFTEAAIAFGQILAANKIRLVYGGGENGLMGAVANSVVDNDGDVLGIIPEFLIKKEGGFKRGKLITVSDMHARKRRFFEESDAFVALPGGLGTLEETVEQMTWNQIGHSHKPILLANIEQFWNPLIYLLDHMREEAFIRPGLEFEQLVANDVDEILPVLCGEKPSRVPSPLNGKGQRPSEPAIELM